MHRSLKLPSEHQSVEGPRPVILQIVAAGSGEVLLKCVIHVLNQYLILARLPHVQVFPNLP